MTEPNQSQPNENIQKNPPFIDDLPDFDEIEAEFSENSHMEMEIDGPDALGPAGVLTKDQFYMAFSSVFDFSGMFLQLQSLPIQNHEVGSARAASDAIYDVAEKSPWFRFLIEPGNEWVQRALVVGVFAFGKVTAVKAEIDQRSAPKPKAANDQQQPGMEAFNVREKS